MGSPRTMKIWVPWCGDLKVFLHDRNLHIPRCLSRQMDDLKNQRLSSHPSRGPCLQLPLLSRWIDLEHHVVVFLARQSLRVVTVKHWLLMAPLIEHRKQIRAWGRCTFLQLPDNHFLYTSVIVYKRACHSHVHTACIGLLAQAVTDCYYWVIIRYSFNIWSIAKLQKKIEKNTDVFLHWCFFCYPLNPSKSYALNVLDKKIISAHKVLMFIPCNILLFWFLALLAQHIRTCRTMTAFEIPWTIFSPSMVVLTYHEN